MSSIVWEALAIKLSSIPGENKELDSSDEGVDTFGETAGLANQSFEIVPKFSIHTFHTIGFALVGHRCVGSRCIDQGFVCGKQITEIPDGLGRIVKKGLECRFIALSYNTPANNATAATLNEGYEVESVFFLPT